jgi:hypothetical protein
MNFVLIIVGFVVIAALYLLYKYFANQPLSTGLVKLDNAGNSKITIDYEKLTNPGSSTFSYEMWLFISTGSPMIFYRGADAKPDFGLKISSGKLEIIATKDAAATAANTILSVNTFPYQKWVHVVINVINKKTVELFMNGKLVDTIESEFDIQHTKTSQLVVGAGGGNPDNSYLTRFFRTDKVLTADDVWKNYTKGNGVSNVLSNFIKYNMNISITKGDELVREMKLIPI